MKRTITPFSLNTSMEKVSFDFTFLEVNLWSFQFHVTNFQIVFFFFSRARHGRVKGFSRTLGVESIMAWTRLRSQFGEDEGRKWRRPRSAVQPEWREIYAHEFQPPPELQQQGRKRHVYEQNAALHISARSRVEGEIKGLQQRPMIGFEFHFQPLQAAAPSPGTGCDTDTSSCSHCFSVPHSDTLRSRQVDERDVWGSDSTESNSCRSNALNIQWKQRDENTEVNLNLLNRL